MDHKAAAEKKLKVADHLLSTTYPIVKDPKLLMSVIENLHEAMDEAITAVLQHEQIHFNDDSQEKLELFRRKIMTKYSLKKEMLDFIKELRDIMDEHKSSSVEFSKKEKFVISDNDYNLKTLTAEKVKPKVMQAKKDISILFKIIGG